jgi:hypothetical protein
MTQPTTSEQKAAFTSTLGTLLSGVKAAVATALKVATLLDSWASFIPGAKPELDLAVSVLTEVNDLLQKV